MRDILFRGKRNYNRECYYGSLIKWSHFNGKGFEDTFSIKDVYSNEFLVIPETIEQFTGLFDKKGKKIFEGDILVSGNFEKNMIVIFRKDLASFALSAKGWMYDHYFGEAVDPGNTEIIGNIQDNPELL